MKFGNILILALSWFFVHIVNGEVKFKLAHRAPRTSIDNIPYHVQYDVNREYRCGGALISTLHVLTAAHCVFDFVLEPHKLLSEEIIVRVGSDQIGVGQEFRVQRISHYYAYSRSYYAINDCAVITLRDPVVESSKVRVVALPPLDLKLRKGSLVTVSGFGSAEWYGPISRKLKNAITRILSDQECLTYYNNHYGVPLDSNAVVCAAYGSGYGTCGGDSGGPLVYNNQIVGIVSFGTGKCDRGDPDVFARVSNYLRYIQYEMGGLGIEYSYLSKAVDIDQIRSFYG